MALHVTNHRGRVVRCLVCQTEELHEYKSYKPAFVDAIDTEYIGWCIEHKGQGLLEYRIRIGEVDRLNTASSNS